MPVNTKKTILPWIAATLLFSLVWTCLDPFEAAKAQTQDLGTSMAILGDSISTGAASHPQLTLSRKSLWDIFQNPNLVYPKAEDLAQDLPWKFADPLGHPTTTWPTWRELHYGVDYTFLVLVNAISQSLLNTEEYSWGAQLAQGLGINPSQISIAAENGAKIANMNRQVDRLLAARNGVLPHKVFILFTGNDICGPTVPMMTPAEDFAESLKGGLQYLSRHNTPPGGTDVYVVAYLNVTQIVTNPSILEKKVLAFGETTTCANLHKQLFTPTEQQVKSGKDQIESQADQNSSLPPWFPWLFNALMPPSPAGMCPNLFANASAETLSSVANRMRAFRKKSEDVVTTLQNKPPPNSGTPGQEPTAHPVRFHWLPSPESIRFEADDIAGDCFHLSPKGQGKLALDVARALGL